MLRRTLLGLLALAIVLALVVALNTWRQGSRQVQVEPIQRIAIDEVEAAETLATAVRARTVSGGNDPAAKARALDQLQSFLRARYPLVHSRLELETFGGHTLVFRWAGRDSGAKPFALMAHQDVVPVAPGTEGQWEHPPFDGVIADGYVWGRGTWDDKGNLIAELEAVERLLSEGFVPSRTVYLIFGHDEELTGEEGAARVAAHFKQKGVHLDFVLDEGLVITDGIVPGLDPPAALIGIAEKGYVSVRLVAQGTGGHSSMPPVTGSAIGILAAALGRIEANPMRTAIAGVARQMFDAVAPEMHGLHRIALSNLYLTEPVLLPLLQKGSGMVAMLRTTTALTEFHAGNKENVIPGRAEAIINFRLLPGDSRTTVVAHLQRVVDDERIAITALPDGSEPSRVSSTDSSAYRRIERTVREVFPQAIVAPGLMVGGSDARHFEAVADQVFRFSPVMAKPDDLPRFHGTNERLGLSNFANMIRFYHRLVQQAASEPT